MCLSAKTSLQNGEFQIQMGIKIQLMELIVVEFLNSHKGHIHHYLLTTQTSQ